MCMRKMCDFIKKWAFMFMPLLLLSGCTKPGADAISKCTSCVLFSTIFRAMCTVADGAMARMSKIGLILLGIGTLYWLVIVFVRGMWSRQRFEQDFGKTLLIMAGKIAIVAVLLLNTDSFYYICQKIVTPFLNIFFSFASQVIKDGAVVSQLTTQTAVNAFNEYITQPAGAGAKLLNPDLTKHVEVILYYIQEFIWRLRIFGIQMTALGNISWLVGLMGLLVILLSYGLSLSFTFLLIEPLIRLALFLVLMPLWFVGLCFAPTKSISLVAMKSIVVAAGQLFLTAVYFAVFFILVLGYSRYANITWQNISDEGLSAAISSAVINLYIYFGLFMMVYYFIRTMNKSIGYVLNENLGEGFGANFMIGIATIAKWVATIIILIVTSGASSAQIAAKEVAKEVAKQAAKTATKGAAKGTAKGAVKGGARKMAETALSGSGSSDKDDSKAGVAPSDGSEGGGS